MVAIGIWRAVQAASGLAMASFATLHIGNTLLAAISQELYDSTLLTLREAYQRPTIEAAGMVALAAHLVSNYKLSAVSRKTRDPLHTATGVVLMSGIGFHVLHMRVLPAFASHSTVDFAFVHSAFKHNSLIMPLYSLFFAAGTYHVFNGIARAIDNLHIATIKPNLVKSTIASILLVGSVALMAINGSLYDVDTFHHDMRATFDSVVRVPLSNQW